MDRFFIQKLIEMGPGNNVYGWKGLPLASKVWCCTQWIEPWKFRKPRLLARILHNWPFIIVGW